MRGFIISQGTNYAFPRMERNKVPLTDHLNLMRTGRSGIRGSKEELSTHTTPMGVVEEGNFFSEEISKGTEIAMTKKW